MQKKNKYNAKRTEYNGVVYDSAKEAGFAKKLDLLKMAQGPHKVMKVERQVPFQITVNDVKIAKYILDFRVTYADGRIEHIDVKGMKSGAAYQMFKLKKKLVEALYFIEIKEA
jgi:hypothetical protein